MREDEKLVACPISTSSNNDAYNDICKATGKTCPFYIDEGMSVCKSKAQCLAYFAKRWSKLNHAEVAKLIASDTKSDTGRKNKYTNTIKRDKDMQNAEKEEMNLEADSFLEGLEDALKSHSEPSVEHANKTVREKKPVPEKKAVAEKKPVTEKETAGEYKPISAIEMYKRK